MKIYLSTAMSIMSLLCVIDRLISGDPLFMVASGLFSISATLLIIFGK